jgi:hypothetical protein
MARLLDLEGKHVTLADPAIWEMCAKVGRLQRLRGRDNHAGLLVSRQPGASRACCIGSQIAKARLVDNPAAEGRGWQKLDLSGGEQIRQSIVNAGGDCTRRHRVAKRADLNSPDTAACRC